MLLLIIGLVILAAGIIIGCRDFWRDSFEVFLTVMGGVIVVIFSITIMIVNIPAQADYEKKLYERDILVYRLENRSEEATENEMLYTEIVEFNNNLKDIKRFAKSPFTNWFFNQRIANDIDYIDIEGAYEKSN